VTAICPGGGTSVPNTGAAAVVDYSSGLLAAIFAAYDITWLIPVIPLVGLGPLTLATFCASDPPTVPTFTSAETNAILQLTFGADFNSGISKLKDWALNAIWYDACHCTGGAATPLVAPSAPAGTPIFQPPVSPGTTPCYTVTYANDPMNASSSIRRFTASLASLGSPTSVRVTTTTSVASGTGPAITDTVEFNGVSGALISAASAFAQTHSQTLVHTYSLPPNTYTVDVNIQANGTTGITAHTTVLDVFCNGDAPGGVQSPCCPPDTATQAYLDLILKAVTLIQRQAVPFAYVTSTAHTGLSGAGTIPINGLLGVKVTATTVPANLGVIGTTPAEHFDMGFVTFGTADGYPHSYRLEHSPQLMLPARCSAFTEFAYDLPPGVVITVTELLREP
jgi:hypothetical protein